MQSGYYVAIFGGSVAGAEAASELARRGIRSAVFEQHALPYGKLESGLPKWHMNLRDRQERIIDEKLQNEGVEFVPLIRLGRDLDIESVCKAWGFSAVLLATGAWRDRPLPASGFDRFIAKGFHYQNPFVNWFNHNHEPDYKGQQFVMPDNAIIIGGGLASIDVAKIVMIELVRKALQDRGIERDVFTLERKGIAAVLDEAGLSLAQLGLNGCTLYTRQGIREMPLNAIPENASQEEIEKAYESRQRIVEKQLEKFLFKIRENYIAHKPIAQNDRLVGAVFQETRTVNNQIIPVDGAYEEVYTPLLISAIGSIPEQIKGLPLKGEIYDVQDMETGKIKGYDHVFALGNAVTGRGNIRQSQTHGRQVSENIVDQYFAWQEEDYQEIFTAATERVDQRLQSIGEQLQQTKPLSAEQIQKLQDKIKQLQQRVGYDGNYPQWIQKHLPVRLESIINQE